MPPLSANREPSKGEPWDEQYEHNDLPNLVQFQANSLLSEKTTIVLLGMHTLPQKVKTYENS